MTALELAAQQLSRMRGMNAMYHRQFFIDVFRTTVVGLALFGVGFWGIEAAFLAVPFVALIGAAQTAFDASYLIFSRHYSHALEGFINQEMGRELLVAHKMEETYLFPLDTTKIVTIPIDRAPTWFGFMTFFYTIIGVYSYAAGLTFGWNFLTLSGWEVRYGVSLGFLTLATLAMGVWWFIRGTGEQKLRAILDETFER